jgi:hypothetical protein
MARFRSKKVRWALWLGAVVFPLLLCGLIPVQVIYDDGMKEMPFTFIVLDADTQQPLEGVLIRLYDEIHSRTDELRTGADGRASIDLTCMITCQIRSGLLISYSRRSIYYPDRILAVSKKGFKDKVPLYLKDLDGWCHVGDYTPPPVMKIELERGESEREEQPTD